MFAKHFCLLFHKGIPRLFFSFKGSVNAKLVSRSNKSYCAFVLTCIQYFFYSSPFRQLCTVNGITLESCLSILRYLGREREVASISRQDVAGADVLFLITICQIPLSDINKTKEENVLSIARRCKTVEINSLEQKMKR